VLAFVSNSKRELGDETETKRSYHSGQGRSQRSPGGPAPNSNVVLGFWAEF